MKYAPTKFKLPTSKYDKAKADRAVMFIEQLCHTIGEWKGVPFELIPWQEQIVRDVFGIVDKKTGYRQFRQCYIEIGKKNGKALALDTPIPTPAGWTTMGDIKVGDVIFGKDGGRYNVTFATDVMTGHKCYKVSFSDGTSIIADAEHLWEVNSWFINPGAKVHQKGYKHRTPEEKAKLRYDGNQKHVLTTEQLKATLKCNRGTTNNHSVDVASPIDCEPAELPLPPYTLGAWLGDGISEAPAIIMIEKEILEHVQAEGIPTVYIPSSGKVTTYYLRDKRYNKFNRNPIRVAMESLNLIKNKHIPDVYLRASREQRMELMRGLMDTDGYCGKDGQCEFTTVNPQIRDGFVELARSLGYKPRVCTARAMCRGKDCGEKYRVQFYAFKDNSCFHLSRKTERLKERTKHTRSGVRHITAIEEVESVPVRCIQVDSPDHLYLAGESFIPTHNTELDAAIALKLLCADDEPSAEIYGCAADRRQASICFNVAVGMVQQNSVLRKRIKIIESQKRMVYMPNGSFYQVLSAEAYSKHGFNVHGLLFDELHAMPNRKLFDVMTKGSGDARRQPLFFYTTTAGDDVNSICYEQHRKALDIIDGKKHDASFYPVLYAAADDDDWTDPKTWAKANPSLGVTITEDRVREACEQAQQNPAEENAFRQLRLSQWVKQAVRWMPMAKWDLCNGEVNAEELEGRVCYGGLDLSSTTDITAFVLVFPPETEDGVYKVMPFFWIPEETLDLRVRRDHVPYDIWKREGYIETTEGNVIHYGYIEKFIEALGERYNIREIAFDRWGAVQMVQNLEGMGFTVVPFGQGFKDMSPPTKELMKLVLEQRIAHGGHPALRWMVDNIAIRTDPAGNIKADKEKSTEKIDGAIATIMALDRAIRNGNDTGASVYDERGVLFL